MKSWLQMSRSRRKNKIHAITTADSEKENKREANRRFRRVVKQKVKLGDSDFPSPREMSDVWGFEKDGKIYDPKMDDKEMRK